MEQTIKWSTRHDNFDIVGNNISIWPSRASVSAMGMHLIEDSRALETTAERLFPPSPHRSTRIRKKLIQRHGSEFRMVPTAYQVGNHTMVIHPALADRLRREITAQINATAEQAILHGHP